MCKFLNLLLVCCLFNIVPSLYARDSDTGDDRTKRQIAFDLGSEDNPTPLAQLFGLGNKPKETAVAGKHAAPQTVNLGNLLGAFLGGGNGGQVIQPNQGGGLTLDFGGLVRPQNQGRPPFNQGGRPQPGGFPQQPGGFQQQPGGFQQQPGGFQQQHGGFQHQHGGFQQKPGGFQQQPGGFPQRPPQQQPGGFPQQQPGGFPQQQGAQQQRPGGGGAGKPFVPLTQKPRPFCHERPNAINCIATPPPTAGNSPEVIPDSILNTELGDYIDASNKFVVPGSAIGTDEDRSYYLGFGQPNYAYQNCFTPFGFRGKCRFLEHCSRPEITADFDTFMQYACPVGSDHLGVCCPKNVNAAFQNGVPQTTTSPPTTTTTTTTTTRPPGQPSKAPVSRGCGVSYTEDTRIVGGKPADPREFPWMAALLRDKDDPYCGGVLVTDRHILTASHCVNRLKASDIIVRLGEYDFSNNASLKQDFPVDKIIMHESYNSVSQANDIALLKLAKPTTFNEDIWPICLPSPTLDATDKLATVIGWGTVGYAAATSTVLKKVNLPVWKISDCKAAYSQPVTDLQLCAGYKTADNLGDSCQGDSGGPLQLQMQSGRWSVIGVVSWAIGCSEKKHPGVYTKVTAYLDWIKENASK